MSWRESEWGSTYNGVCCRIMGQRLMSTICWRRFGDLQKVRRGRFDEKVMGRWIRGKDVEAFSKDPFESVEARIISSGEGKVMSVTGEVGGGVGVMEELGIAVSGSRGQDSHGRQSPW